VQLEGGTTRYGGDYRGEREAMLSRLLRSSACFLLQR
jgi:hypothetical protein